MRINEEAAMSSWNLKRQEKQDGLEPDFRILEVVMVRKDVFGNEMSRAQTLLVENEQETLRYVQENMDDFIRNVVHVRKLQEQDLEKINQNALMFQETLAPIFSLLGETGENHILEHMTSSLKKAMIVMALKKFDGDLAMVADLLGIDPESIEEEMTQCGLEPEDWIKNHTEE
jgi:hypothetical protein